MGQVVSPITEPNTLSVRRIKHSTKLWGLYSLPCCSLSPLILNMSHADDLPKFTPQAFSAPQRLSMTTWGRTTKKAACTFTIRPVRSTLYPYDHRRPPQLDKAAKLMHKELHSHNITLVVRVFQVL